MLRCWLLLSVLCWTAMLATAAGVTSFAQTVTANGRSFAVKGVRVDLTSPGVHLKTGLAWEHVGRTESLGAIAKRYGAVAAINGSFFDAYTADALKNPDMSLISEGTLVFKSNIGCVLGFEEDNTPRIGCTRYRLGGTVTRPGGRAQSWFAYWMNRKPTAASCVTIFTPRWGKSVDPAGGVSVVVTGGAVTAITREAAAIPADGYVIHIRGEAGLLARFQVGSAVTFAPETTVDGEAGGEAWGRVREAVGAGPRVLVQGTPTFAPGNEGFTDPKILSMAGARSAVGFTADRKTLFMITVSGARVSDLGHVLKALGCSDGMNLDGGASSGLWYRGAYLTSPGRAISNALLVMED